MTDFKKNTGEEFDSEKDKAKELKTIAEKKAKDLKDYDKVKESWTEQHWEEKAKEIKDTQKRDKDEEK